MTNGKDGVIEALVEAEESVISIAFIGPHLIEAMSALVSHRDFFDRVLADIWGVCLDLRVGNVDSDARMLILELKKRGLLEQVGGMSALARIINRQPTVTHYEYYCREVARYAELRRLEYAAGSLLTASTDPKADPQKLLNAFTAKTEGVGNSKDAGFRHFKEVVDHIVESKIGGSEEEDAARVGFMTGLPSLDALIGGFAASKLYLLGARTGVGKTALAANFCMSAVAQGKCAWFSSLEMKNAEVTERIMSSCLKMNHRRWLGRLSDQELQAVREFRDTVAASARLWMTDVKESYQSIRAKCRLRKSCEGLDFLIVDNLQLVRPFDYRSPKHERTKQLTEAFKDLAKEMNIAVLILCQLSVDSENTKGRSGVMEEPDNSSWADSKRIVDDADVAMLLHRSSRESTDARLIISKQRNGPLGAVPLNWAGHFQTFSDANVDQLG